MSKSITASKLAPRAASGGGVELCIYDQIGTGGVTAMSFRDDMARVGTNERVVLRINSPGGSVTEGIAIAGAIKRHGGEVVGVIDGIAASIASLILVSCDKAIACEGTFLMIHNVSVLAEGGPEDMRRAAGVMEAMQKQIVTAYAAKTGLSENRLAQMMDEETWMTADEALALGFVDEVVPAEKSVNEIRKFDLSKFKNAARVQGATKPKINEPKNMIATFTNEEVENKVKERLADFAEMDALVNMCKKRDGKDFSALAEKSRREGWSLDMFREKLLTAEKWQNASRDVVGAGEEHFAPRGTIGDLIVSEQNFRNAVQNGWTSGSRVQIHIPNHDRFAIQNATLSQSGSGMSTIEQRPEIILRGVQRILVMDLLGMSHTNSTNVRYIREVSFTNAATTVAEGATKPEASLSLEQFDAPIRKVAVFTKITDEMLQDFPQLSGYVNMRLPLQVMTAEEEQILTGDGSGSNLTGILQTEGLQTTAVGAGTATDALYHALTLIRVNAKFEPDGFVIHPSDWETLRLTKDANSQYFGGGPFTGAYGQKIENVESLWGKPVAITTAIPQGTALAGAFRIGAEVIRRMGLIIDFTNSDGTDFVKNVTTIRAETRLGLSVFHTAAFCEVTGL